MSQQHSEGDFYICEHRYLLEASEFLMGEATGAFLDREIAALPVQSPHSRAFHIST